MQRKGKPIKKLSERQMEFSGKLTVFLMWIFTHRNWGVTFGEVWRPDEMQEIYWKQGKTKLRYSKHQKRLAVDLNLFIDGWYVTSPEAYRPLGEFWESLGGRWGGRFGVERKDYDMKIGWDSNHFEAY